MRTSVAVSDGREEKGAILALAALAHAVLVAVLWWAAMYGGVRPLSGPAWALLAWAWLFWPVIAFGREYSSLLVVGALGVGALVIAPTVPEMYAVTAWSIFGFAP